MRDWFNKNKFYIAACILLIIQAIIIVPNLSTGQPFMLLWFCNHAPLFFALGFIFHKKEVVKAIINVGLIPQFFWVMDFFSKLIFDVYIFDVTRYIFESFRGINLVGSVLAHTFPAFIVLSLVYQYKTKKITLVYSSIYLIILFSASLLFTPPEENINLIYKIDIVDITFPSYTIFWPIMAFVLIVLPTYFFQIFLYKKKMVL